LLNAEALADLRYLEPTRTRQRVIDIFNELYAKVFRLEGLHHDSH